MANPKTLLNNLQKHPDGFHREIAEKVNPKTLLFMTNARDTEIDSTGTLQKEPT